jgi:hypothetical protein
MYSVPGEGVNTHVYNSPDISRQFAPYRDIGAMIMFGDSVELDDFPTNVNFCTGPPFGASPAPDQG